MLLRLPLLLCFALIGSLAAYADEAAPPTEQAVEQLAPSDWLVLPRVGDYRRTAFHQDPIEAAWVLGAFEPPQAGDEVRGAGGRTAEWRRGTAEHRGRAFSGGYAYAEFEQREAGVWLLDARGAAAVCLNDQWVVGDPYGLGAFQPPVVLEEGVNRVLVHLADSSARPRFLPVGSEPFLLPASTVLPNYTPGEKQRRHGRVLLVNPTSDPLRGYAMVTRVAEEEPTLTPLPEIGPLAVYAAPLVFDTAETTGGDTQQLRVELLGATESEAATTFRYETSIASVDGALQTRTFVSQIDGAAQPYTVRLPDDRANARGVVLLLHDAGESHAEAAARIDEQTAPPLSDWIVVAPAGRGRFGSDWEAWSARDAIEALDDFQSDENLGSLPVVVAGRGMGGHGALALATTYPMRFAGVGAHDAWISHASLGRSAQTPTDAGPIRRLLDRPPAADDPDAKLTNLSRLSVGIGVSEDASPALVTDAHRFRERLGEFHTSYAYREGVRFGETIAEVLPTIADSRDIGTPDRIDYCVRAGFGPSSVAWARIEAPRRQGQLSRIELRRDTSDATIIGSTENVQRLVLTDRDFADEQEPTVVLDGSKPIVWRRSARRPELRLVRDERGAWQASRSRWPRSNKSVRRPGGFASAFANRPLLVYATGGADAEKAWAAAKARYDAQLFLYRFNGRLDVVADRDFRLASEPDRNVVFYGNESTNSAARFWLQAASVHARRGVVEVWPTDERRDARPESGDDLGVLMVTPRPQFVRRPSAEEVRLATAALIGGTGIRGMRATTRLRYFWSGIAYPDVSLFDATAIGVRDELEPADIRAAGYLSPDWDVASGELIWREIAL